MHSLMTYLAVIGEAVVTGAPELKIGSTSRYFSDFFLTAVTDSA